MLLSIIGVNILMITKEKVGRRVSQARCNNGLSQDELAKRVGYVTKGAISRIEAGEVAVKIEDLEKYAQALNVSVNYILGIDNENNKLSTQEEEMLANYSRLNSLGKSKADDYVQDLTEHEKYTCPDDEEVIKPEDNKVLIFKNRQR